MHVATWGCPLPQTQADVGPSWSLGRARAEREFRPDEQPWAGKVSCGVSRPLSWAEDLSQARGFARRQSSGQ